MTTETYYDRLGVSKDASHDDIKKAYRQLAKKHHPDKGGDGDLFAKINQAYDVIGDPNKRAEYDNQLRYGNRNDFQFRSTSHSAQEAEEMIREHLRRQFGFNTDWFHGQYQKPKPTNRTIRLNMRIPAVDTLKEQVKIIELRMPNGKMETLELKIPRGVQSGQTIQYTGIGDNSVPSAPRGDLLVRYELEFPPNFASDGIDIYTDLTINCIEAMVGCTKEVTGIDGAKFSLNIPAGIQNGSKLALADQGLATLKRDGRGRLIVFVNIYILKEINEEQKAVLKRINDSLTKEAV